MKTKFDLFWLLSEHIGLLLSLFGIAPKSNQKSLGQTKAPHVWPAHAHGNRYWFLIERGFKLYYFPLKDYTGNIPEVTGQALSKLQPYVFKF